MLIKTCASNFVYFVTTNQVMVGHGVIHIMEGLDNFVEDIVS